MAIDFKKKLASRTITPKTNPITYPEVKLRFLRIMLVFVLLALFHMLRIEF